MTDSLRLTQENKECTGSTVLGPGGMRERQPANGRDFLLGIVRPVHVRAVHVSTHTWLNLRLPFVELGCNDVLQLSVSESVFCSKVCPGFQNQRIWLFPLDLHQALGLSELAFPICRVRVMLTSRFQRCGETLPNTSRLYLVKP